MATWTIYKKLNVSPNSFPLVIPIKQYSSDFALKLKLYSTDGDLDIEAGATTKIRGTKRDGNGFELTGTRIGNTCTFSGTKAQMQQMTAAHGRCVFEVVVEHDGKELITGNFYLEVQRAAMDAGTVTSESIIEEFEDFQSKITAAQAAATAAQEQADRAEAAAESIDFGIDPTLTQPGQAADAAAVGDALGDLQDTVESFVSGMSDEAKTALLACFQHVAWVDEHGQSYYNALESALYEDVPAALRSIAATFNQGSAIIYTDTALDDLKQYLTVTARYSDGTSRAVTGYILSGTLREGTSAVTVTYGGKSTSFTIQNVIDFYNIWEWDSQNTNHSKLTRTPTAALRKQSTVKNSEYNMPIQ